MIFPLPFSKVFSRSGNHGNDPRIFHKIKRHGRLNNISWCWVLFVLNLSSSYMQSEIRRQYTSGTPTSTKIKRNMIHFHLDLSVKKYLNTPNHINSNGKGSIQEMKPAYTYIYILHVFKYYMDQELSLTRL